MLLAARNLASTICTGLMGEVSSSSMVPERCSSAKLPMVTNGSTNSDSAPTLVRMRRTRYWCTAAGCACWPKANNRSRMKLSNDT